MLVVESKEIVNLEKEAVRYGISLSEMMDQAGTKLADFVSKLVSKSKRKKICIVCGSGNNGGDGLVAARLLSVMCNVTVVLADGKPKTKLAIMNYNLLSDKVKVVSAEENYDDCMRTIRNTEIIVDAVYGIGFHDALRYDIAELIDMCNNNKSAIKVAVDLPSGIVCDTGEIVNVCFNADYTITFSALKPLHVLYPSMDYCGEITVADIGIPKDVMKKCVYTMMTTNEFIAKNPIRSRRKSAHKGMNGTLLSICGSYGMAGAAILSGRAALRTGVGLLRSAVVESIYPIIAPQLTESVFIPLKEKDGKIDFSEFDRILTEIFDSSSAVLIGCGLGKGKDIDDLVTQLVQYSTKPIVIDADGINALCSNINVLKSAAVPIILTPHPGEMARLRKTSVQAIQLDRYNIARNFAQEYGVTVVLKGANTLIADPGGAVYVNLTGNNGMAKGGSGDVLAGMIASFLAQGLSTDKAAAYAVYYHGLSGDRCAEKYSARSMLPGDMTEELMHIFG